MLSVANKSLMLSVVYAECRKQILNAECRYAECCYVECHYAECRGALHGSIHFKLNCKIKAKKGL
jgi:hypothetical protein